MSAVIPEILAKSHQQTATAINTPPFWGIKERQTGTMTKNKKIN
jgi:hypothetical protein